MTAREHKMLTVAVILTVKQTSVTRLLNLKTTARNQVETTAVTPGRTEQASGRLDDCNAETNPAQQSPESVLDPGLL